jgi:signal transduction histidine kinase
MGRNRPTRTPRAIAAWRWFVERYLPTAYTVDADLGRRLQLVLILSALTTVVSAGRAVVMLRAGWPDQAAVIAVVPLLASLIFIGMLRWPSPAVGGNVLMAVLFAAATSLIARRGGLGTPVALSLSGFPVIATFVSGRRAGAFWLLLAWTEIGVFVALHRTGAPLVDQLSPERRVTVHAVGAAMYSFALFIVALAYEATRRAALTTAVSAELEATKAAEEARMSRVERMAAVGQLAAGVAHEVNNPLAYVQGNLTFLRRRLRGSRPLEDADVRALQAAADEALVGITRIGTIVRDLKTFVRDGSADDVERCDLAAVLGSVVRLTEKQSARITRVDVHLPERTPWVVATDAKLAQVLLNLLLNALQAFDGHSTDNQIDVRVAVDSHNDREVDDVVVTVQDNGKGMSPETLARATEPFFTTKPVGVGTGLGLSVCRNVVESLGGALDIESEQERGTTVTIRLVWTEPAPTPSQTTPPPAHSRRGRRVLLVDDDALVRRALRRSLVGHEIIEAADGKEALRILKDEDPPDVILCDLMMPELGGLDLYELVAAQDANLAARFVFLTGGVYDERERKFLQSADVPVLEKPVDADLLEGFVSAAPRPRSSDES